FTAGKLHEKLAAAVASHLAGCAACRQKVDSQPPDSFLGNLQAAAPRGGTRLAGSPSPGSRTELPRREAEAVRRAEPAKTDDLPAELAASSKFQVLGKLGQGGMGSVWKATHRFLGKEVAIKVMSGAAVGDAEAQLRFLKEMQAVGQLKHRNIVPALDA